MAQARRATFSTPIPEATLHEIHRGPSPTCIIIVVPGHATSPLPWEPGSRSIWSELGSSFSSSVVLYGFEHRVSSGKTFRGQDILESGPVLLHKLNDLRLSNELRKSPIFFICHSLGGILVKQALCLASQNPDQHRRIMTNVAGTCFLGTPHSKSSNVDVWEPVKFILDSSLRKVSGETFNAKDAAILANVSQRFEEADLQCPVLSVCEDQETKIKRFLRPDKKSILVDHTLAKTNLRYEKLLELDRVHHELCNITRETFIFKELLRFVDAAFEKSLSIATNDDPTSPLEQAATIQSSNPESSVTPEGETNDTSVSIPNETLGDSPTNGPYEVIPNLTDFTPSRVIAKLPCYLLSTTPNPAFFGRTEVLKVVEDELLPTDTMTATDDTRSKTLRTFALCAPGGMGKTQIADKFVETNKERFDAVFWLHADQTSKLAEGYSQIAAKLGLVEEGSTNARDQIVCRDLVKGWLAKPMKRSSIGTSEADWLIVFDNVDDPDTLNDFWPVDGTGSILVTSRNPLAKTNVYYAGNSGIDLQPFSTESAAQFLLRLTQRLERAKQFPLAHAVAARLGGFPLALTQMASLILRQQLSFEEFLQRYSNEEDIEELHKLRLGGSRDSYYHTLSTVWHLDRLDHGAALLEVLSLLDPDRIHETILTEGSSEIFLSGYPTTTAAYQNARYELLQSSLVTRNIDQGRLLIHRVIQDSAKSKMTPERLAKVFEAAVELLRAVYPPALPHQDLSVARWTQCEPLFPHIIRLKELYQRSELPPQYVNARLSFAEILNGAGWFHHDHERRNSTGADCFGLAQSICESIIPSRDDEELATRVDTLLGDVHYSRGCVAIETNDANSSMVHFGAFIETRLRISNRPGGKKEDTYLAVAYNEEGNACMISGRYQEATEFYYKSMDTYKSLLDFSRPMISLPMVNLGLANWLLGDFDKALEILFIALADRAKAFGEDDNVDFKTGRILHALGNVKMSQGQLKESFQYHQRALQQYKSTIGSSHHRTADVCHRLADHYVRLGKNDTAITLLDQALKIWSDKRHYRPERARTSYKKYLVLQDMGQGEEAQKCLQHALAFRSQLVTRETKSEESLTEADFDELVVFWSK